MTAATTPTARQLPEFRASISSRNDPDGSHAANGAMDFDGGQAVLQNLIRNVAVAGFLDGERAPAIPRPPVAATAQASTTASTCAWEKVANRFCAGAARLDTSRACWMEMRSRSEGSKRSTPPVRSYQQRLPQRRSDRRRRRSLVDLANFSVSRPPLSPHPLPEESPRCSVRPRDHVHRPPVADASRCRRSARIGRGLHRTHIAAHDDRDVTGTDIFLADQ